MKPLHRLLIVLTLASAFGALACTGSTETPSDTPQTSKVELAESVTDQVKRILEGYYNLKDAMVTSDSAQVTASAEAFLEVIMAFDTNGLEESVGVRLTSEVDAIRYGVQNVAEASSIEAQREFLPALTENMINLIANYDVTDQPVYKQYCPMAFNDKGAFWLSKSDSVINPYFGDMMLRCGEVVETLE